MIHGIREKVRPELVFLILAAALCTAVLSVLASAGYWERPTVVAPAVMADLALGLPVLGYFCLVRTRRADPLILLPLLLGGLLLARWWIPEAHRLDSRPVVVLGVLFECAVLLVLFLRVRRIREIYVREKARLPYPVDAAAKALAEVLGARLGGAVFSEGAAIWYGLTGFGRETRDHPAGRVFPCFRRNAYPAILGALLFLILIETVVVHLLVGLVDPRAAWLLSALGIYSIVWLLGDFHAARQAPTLVTDLGLHLRCGLRWRLDVPWGAIEGIRADPSPGKGLKMVLLGQPDLWIELREPRAARGIFGIERRVEWVGVGLDDPALFREVLEDRISRWGG